jgi:endoglycosylceramidase
VDASFENFFNNSVQGGLQNEYQRSWIAVASHFRSNAWVLGYDPINEPLGLQSREGRGGRHYSVGLSCLYGGSDGQTEEIGSNHTLTCPATVPKRGLIETLLETDTHHLVFPEIDNASDDGHTLFVTKAKDLVRVVYNFHDYCPERSGVTGNPTDLRVCSDRELLTMAKQEQYRPLYDTSSQPGGPAIMMTEFGATNDQRLASLLVEDASTLGLSWIWWSWRYFNDPTGSSAEAVVDDQNHYNPVIGPLTSTHVVAVAGSLLTAQSSQLVGSLTLAYSPTASVHAPTTIYISPYDYPVGYCVYANGATITSKPGAQYLTLDNQTSDGTIVVRIEPGTCVPSL